MYTLLLALAPLLASLSRPVAAQSYTCNITNLCPSEYPCCSEYGFCGTGYYCLGGCNPLYSNTLDSCLPNPICETANYTFADTSRILSNYTYFDGNASEYDWVIQEGNIMNVTTNGTNGIALLLTETNGGTLMSSTRYVHYGTITARMTTGQWAGVVAAFITMSSVKDEIDWEFPGNATTTGQTNYFWQGNIPAQTAGEVETGITDTYANFHDYGIEWTPESLTFTVDGNVTRTILASDCYNNDTGVSEYPNTPSRIQLSLWPAGISSEPEGTIEWAGGMINWNDSDYTSAGAFYSYFQWISVECADENPSNPNSSDTSYVYGTNYTLDTPLIYFSNETTQLAEAGGALSIGPNGARGLLAAFVAFVLAVHLL